MVPVTLVRGDTNDTEVLARMQDLLNAAGAAVELRPFDARDARVSPELLAAVRETGLALMGFQWGKREHGGPPPMVELRRALGVYANIRPIKSLPGVPSRFDDVDMIICRETTEDVYAMLEHESLPGVFEGLKVTTRATCERIHRFAFDIARQRGRKKVTTVHKSNIMKKSDGMFLAAGVEVAAQYPDIEHEEVIVDALCMKLVLTPQRFDVLACGNLYGDIVGDLAAGLTGGAVNTPSINLAPDVTVFTIGQRGAFQGGSDALPMLLSSLYMLEHIGQLDARRRLGAAAEAVVVSGRLPEIVGGVLSGADYFDAVIAELSKV